MFGGMPGMPGTPGAPGNDSAEPSAVNFDVALRAARQQLKNKSGSTANDSQAVQDSVRLANLWLDNATSLPDSGARPEAWSPDEWLTNTMPMWKRLVEPVAKQMARAQLDMMPAEAREMLGPLSTMITHFNSMGLGTKLGRALGDLANSAFTGTDFGLPVAPSGIIGVVPKNIESTATELSVPKQEVLVYISAREAARTRLFTHVPWLVESIVSSVEEYAVGLELDTSHIEEALRDLNMESGDPARMQESLAGLQNLDLSPKIGSRNAGAASRLETLLALVEGWVEVVVAEALNDRIPSVSALTETWARRRATGGSAEHAFSNIVGIPLGDPRTNEAAELWRRITNAVGTERRDAVWEHPDLLPTADHLENPAAFIDTLLDDAPDESFDEEVAKLEEMLKNEPGPSEDDRRAGGAPDSE
ncbi:zinc-dependent metalloprotease [Corynebacterium aquatimens]